MNKNVDQDEPEENNLNFDQLFDNKNEEDADLDELFKQNESEQISFTKNKNCNEILNDFCNSEEIGETIDLFSQLNDFT